MSKVTISIELDEQDIEELVDEIEEDECTCECEEGFSKEEMLSANQDELNWYLMFRNKYYNTLRHHPEMLDELNRRILLSEQIINNLEMEE